MGSFKSMSIRIAAALLIKNGELSLGEIEAIPFVEDKKMAREIAIKLANWFTVEFDQRRKAKSTIGSWEEVVRLVEPINSTMASKAAAPSATRVVGASRLFVRQRRET